MPLISARGLVHRLGGTMAMIAIVVGHRDAARRRARRPAAPIVGCFQCCSRRDRPVVCGESGGRLRAQADPLVGSEFFSCDRYWHPGRCRILQHPGRRRRRHGAGRHDHRRDLYGRANAQEILRDRVVQRPRSSAVSSCAICPGPGSSGSTSLSAAALCSICGKIRIAHGVPFDVGGAVTSHDRRDRAVDRTAPAWNSPRRRWPRSPLERAHPIVLESHRPDPGFLQHGGHGTHNLACRSTYRWSCSVLRAHTSNALAGWWERYQARLFHRFALRPLPHRRAAPAAGSHSSSS